MQVDPTIHRMAADHATVPSAMHGDDRLVIDYQPSPRRASRRMYVRICVGVACGEAVSALLVHILISGGPIFPLTVVYPHLFVLVEVCPDIVHALPGWLEMTINITVCFVLGPLLFGWYALLPAMRRRWLWIALAGTLHIALFLWVCYLRDAYRFM